MPTKTARRASYKGRLTQVKNSLEKFAKEASNLDKVEAHAELIGHRDSVERIEAKFTEIQSEIIRECTLETKPQEEEELAMFLEECSQTHFEISKLLAIYNTHPSNYATPEEPNNSGKSSPEMAQLLRLLMEQNSRMNEQLVEQRRQREADQQRFDDILARSGATPRRAKLEPLSVPEFSGNHVEWKSFQNSFISVVHSDTGLSKSQKLQYLRKALKGEAYMVIDHLPISDENYDAAWRIVQRHYDNKLKIVNTHIENFLKQPSISSPTVNNLRRLYTTSASILQALEALEVTSRDPWLIYFITEKLDHESQVLWSREVEDDIPTWEDFENFLEKRCKSQGLCSSSLTKTSQNLDQSNKVKSKPKVEKSRASSYVAVNSQDLCQFCNKHCHKLFRCKEFLALSPKKRLEIANQFKICHNCLSETHSLSACSYPSCKSCNQRHNRLLHDALNSTNEPKGEEGSSSTLPKPWSSQNTTPSSSLSCTEDGGDPNTQILLATARVNLLGPNNVMHSCRAILDSGSQVNLITTSLRQNLRLPVQNTDFTVEGIGSSRHVARHKVDITIQFGENPSQLVSIPCLVLRKVTGEQPNRSIDANSVPIPSHLKLADSEWNVRQPIDLLIGAQYFWQFVQDGIYNLGQHAPLLRNSLFGWLVVGPCRVDVSSSSPRNLTCNVSTLASIESTLKKFWEIEEIERPKDALIEHQEVEELFRTTTKRDSSGRYMVQLPFNERIKELENNRSSAVKQLFYLERKLNKDDALKKEYSRVFDEYLSLNIIEAVPFDELDLPSYYLPHHGVIREQSTSTKVRIVFNASSKSQSGLSLNDCLKAGPVVQPTLVSVLLRFRLHKYALTCDIVKMYLQILLDPMNRDYQRFVWRSNSNEPLRDFRFRTVCFGVAPSPFLATRALNQLVEDEGAKFPLAARTIKSNFYVDDCLASVPEECQLSELRNQLIQLMNRAGIQLAKFKSNCPDVFEDRCFSQETLQFEEQTVKTLGMIWNPNADTFQFKVGDDLHQTSATKRMILSTLARIFDPIGLIGPIVTTAKLILQEVWDTDLTWDEVIPDCLQSKWNIFVQDLLSIQELRIPRWVSTIDLPSSVELHAFCDASFSAYGAAIFLVCEDSDGQRSSKLLISKSRITPLKCKKTGKPNLTIPKAELCGAMMAVQLMDVVSRSLEITNRHFWTDAFIVLHQIHAPHERREKFVRNRIRDILKLSNPDEWRHVSTTENPADLLSRGSPAKKLIASELWWGGPTFLTQDSDDWPPPFNPSCPFRVNDVGRGCANVVTEAPNFDSIYDQLMISVGIYGRMVRILAWCRRAVLIFKLRGRRSTRQSMVSVPVGPLTVKELRSSESLLIHWDQDEHLGHIISAIKTGRLDSQPKFKQIRKLRPFLDAEDNLRVGGRLQNSHMDYDARHPRLLPNGNLARLIAKHAHGYLLHAGPQLLLNHLRQRFWPLNGRNLCRSVVRHCIRCFRVNPSPHEQVMGELPEHRVTDLRPFKATGVDFAGPLLLKTGGRKESTCKAYIAVFICMSTKAIHLELVSSLSTEAFIATLRRFVARRGLPSHIYSDNGTTFIGADSELRRMFSATSAQEEFKDFLSTMCIQWCFNPPKAPHHGGLWEAAVKSCKFHLKRVLGQTPLNFEEMATILAQVEAVLNSRPLVPVSTHPDDPSCLTPGNFLIGQSLTQLPDPDLTHLNLNRLDRWQLCQKIQQDFSRRWKREYLNTLQVRTKWSKPHENIKVGDVVLFEDDQLPSTCWPLGTVEEVFPGRDQRVRVVSVRTTKGCFKRPITKIVKLPLED